MSVIGSAVKQLMTSQLHGLPCFYRRKQVSDQGPCAPSGQVGTARQDSSIALAQDFNLQVLHADEALLVLDKPDGLLCVPGKGKDKQDCLSSQVQQRYPDALVVHRLDQATSGLLVMARGATAQRFLSEAFASRQVRKRYMAVVDGLLDPPEDEWGQIELPILLDWPNRPRRIIDPKGKPSITRWRVLSHNLAEQTTRLELEPVTGRSHQLRVHLQALQHPILGDAMYGMPTRLGKAERLLLHATRLELTHPISLQTMVFSSEPPF